MSLESTITFFKAVIFVLDASNRERLQESRTELVKLLSEKELKDAALLILANKQVGSYLTLTPHFYLNSDPSLNEAVI